MKCPNCGAPYHEQETICSTCGQPLSNADYTPVASLPPRRRKKKKIFILFFILMLLLGMAAAGYYFYISQIQKRCIGAVDQIFALARDMDFSSVDSSLLPEPLKENPNIRSYISEYLFHYLEEYSLDIILEQTGIQIDADQICDEIISSASYEITNVKASYNRCTVTVKTQNKDFSSLPEAIAKKVQESYTEPYSFWENIQDFFSSLFAPSDENAEDKQEIFQDENETDIVASLYDELKESAPDTSATGNIVFGISDGHWTLLSLDENLFFNYYGFPDLQFE